MKLITNYEKSIELKDGSIQHQVIEIVSKEVDSKQDVEELGYEDFEINLYINNKFIADISHVISKNKETWMKLIDSTNWVNAYAEQK